MNLISHIAFCDFDGTVTVNDNTDDILSSYSQSDWQGIGVRYDRGEISHFQMNRQFTKSLLVSKFNLTNFVKVNLKLRKGFGEFVQKCQKNNTKLVVVSSGWDIYIKNILKDFEINVITSASDLNKVGLKSKRILVICNQLKYNDPDRWNLINGWEGYSCKVSSPCKGKILRYFKDRFTNSIAIGNSSTDFCMVELADRVFSTGGLTDLCEKRGYNSIKFDDFRQVVEHI